MKIEGHSSIIILNQRTNGPVNGHLRSAIYTKTCLNIVNRPNAEVGGGGGGAISCKFFLSNDTLTVFPNQRRPS